MKKETDIAGMRDTLIFGQSCAKCRPALNYYLLADWPGEYVDDKQSRFINERVHANIAPIRPARPGAIVCSCYSVGREDIRRAVEAGAWSVAAIGRSLRAGTNCGSCRSELQEIVDACPVPEEA